MALSSSTYFLSKGNSTKAGAKKKILLRRHRNEVEKVVADAKSFSEDRKRDLDKIADERLRESAAR
ncbi:hypothetical protein [Erythrobacter sp. QSSC1-22B]|uniref:hypothetical protein n=1 Tax=Erythrobacter sp. QSSC1-22B TaxID=1860125 RepID=UPI00082E62E6|nr:hypothetical protein [Erythrobacter sp. QSSC1-22B]